MARLKPPDPGSSVVLTHEHTVGRSSSCRLQLPDAQVSGHHAVIRWTGEAWEVRDLGSRNGTFVGGKRLEPGRRRLLVSGDTLSFGQRASAWVVQDLDPPEPMARDDHGAWTVGDDGLLLLPDPDTATACVYEEGGRWVAELEDRVQTLDGAPELVLDARRYELFLPGRVPETREPGSQVVDLGRAELCFRVSMDEEHVELRLTDGVAVVELPHRAHLYLVLDLARARLADARDSGLPPSEQGWRYQDDLITQHRIPVNQWNVVLFRARRQLKRAQVLGADELFERRRGSGQIRLGTGRIRVEAL